MIKFLIIKKKLNKMKIGDYYISRIECYSQGINVSKQNKHHFWVIDRSYSLSSEINELFDDIVENVTKLKFGDQLDLIWFSGNKEYGSIFKNYTIVDSFHSRNFVMEKVKNFRHSVGMTCFSEVLDDLDKNHLNSLNFSEGQKSAVLCFFTDGYPVVDNYQKEIENIQKFCLNLSSKFLKKIIIGYGEYYNLELLNRMATDIGGVFIHNSDLKETRKTFMDVILSENINQGSAILFPKNFDYEDYVIFCSLNGEELHIYNPITTKENEDGVSKSISGNEAYFLTKKEVFNSNKITEKTFYVIAAALVQMAKTDIAMDILNYIGDKYFIDRISNAFTISEYGDVVKSILEASNDQFMTRYREGRVKNYLPSNDAFCIFDLFNLLTDDTKASFLPFHESFQYKRIGKIARTEDDTVRFIVNRDQMVPLSMIQWNKDKMNLSILTKIHGTVDLTKLKFTFEEMDSEVYKYLKSLENPKEFQSFQYRNYTFIKSCILNVDKIPIVCNDLNRYILEGIEGLIDQVIKDPEGLRPDILILNLRKLPIINRKMAKNKISALEMAEASIEVIRLEAKIKVYKEKQNERMICEDVKMEGLSKEVSDFLMNKGFKPDGSYAPKTFLKKNNELIDFYMSKVFKIKVKAASSIPKVSAVETKVKGKKKMNWVEQEMAFALEEVEKTENLAVLIFESKKLLKDIRRIIQKVKFGMIVGKTWFSEFNSFGSCSVTTSDNIEVEFELKEEKVFFE